MCLFCQILEPEFERLVLFVVDAVHSASSQVYIMCPLREKLLCPADQEFYLGHTGRHDL